MPKPKTGDELETITEPSGSQYENCKIFEPTRPSMMRAAQFWMTAVQRSGEWAQRTKSACSLLAARDEFDAFWAVAASLHVYCRATNLGDEMNPKRVYGSYTLLGIIVV